jgi:hypothetical protein
MIFNIHIWAHFCYAALRKNRAFRYYENAFSVFIPLQSLARLNAQSALSFLSLREAQTPDMVVKQFFSTFYASFVFLKTPVPGRHSLMPPPPLPARNDIPVSLALEKFPQTHAVLNRFVQARPFYTSSAADTTCVA